LDVAEHHEGGRGQKPKGEAIEKGVSRLGMRKGRSNERPKSALAEVLATIDKVILEPISEPLSICHVLGHLDIRPRCKDDAIEAENAIKEVVGRDAV